MAKKYYEIFKKSESATEVVLSRVLIPPFWWALLVYFCLFFPLACLIGWTEMAMLLIVFMLAPLIWWHLFSKYPTVVRLTDGHAIVRFRRLFNSAETVDINSSDQPLIAGDPYRKSNPKGVHYYGRVQIETAARHPITIYLQAVSSQEEARTTALDFASLVSKRTGFPTKTPANNVAEG